MELENFKFNKKFGQNFISDKNLLKAIVSDSEITENDEILEIGTGAGTLTLAIAEKAKKVVSYEIDKKLTEFLNEKFKNAENVKIIIDNVLNLPIKEIEKNFSSFYHIIANLPYYLTTPLIFKFLEETNKVSSMTLMVQKEVAEKVVATVGTRKYGILSVMLNYYCSVKIARIVKKEMFYPRPKIDSAILILRRKPNVFFEKSFTDFVKGCFAMKRKTLINNLLKQNFKKQDIEKIFDKMKISLQTRAESLDVSQIRQLYLELDKLKQNRL